MAPTSIAMKNKPSTVSELIFRRARSTDELLALFRLRYAVFRQREWLAQFEPSHEFSFNIDPFDAYAVHTGLFFSADGKEMSVGYHRVVGERDDPDPAVVELVERYPAVFAELSPRPAPLPVLEYWPEASAIRQTYRDLARQYDRVIEGTRLSLVPEIRSLKTAKALLQGQIARVGSHQANEVLLTVVRAGHRRFYERIGFKRAARTSDGTVGTAPGCLACCLMAHPQWMPDGWQPKLREMAAEYTATGQIRFRMDLVKPLFLKECA